MLISRYKHIDGKLLIATQSYGKNLFQLCLLNKKLGRLKSTINKIENDINQGKIKICFGTKSLFNQQNITHNITSNISNYKFNAQSVLFKDHIDWLTSWYDSRSHQFLITGAGEESSGNNNCQAIINSKGFFNLKLRLPNNLIDNTSINNKIKDKFLTIKDIDFGKNNSLLQSSLLSETKKVRILTIAEKIEIKELKNTVFELKKARFSLIKEIRLLNKSNTATDKKILKLDNEIIYLQKEIELKSDIFTFNKKKSNKNDNKENNNKDLLRTRKKKIAIPVTYRFVKNTDRNSPKYGTWSVHFTVDIQEPEIITDIRLGSIGVDLNENHLAVTEVDSSGKLIQSFNIYFNPETYNSVNTLNTLNSDENKLFKLIDSNNNNLIRLPMIENQFKLNEKPQINLSKISSDKTQNILGNAIKIVTDLSLITGKTIIIEKLDFTQKKKQLASNCKLNNKNKFNYNHMISSFAYSKFKEILKSQANKSGLQVIEVNPAYSSLIGLVNYVKPLGLSIHMSASYVIAQRGLNYSNNNKLNNYKIDEKPRLIKINNKNKLEIYTKSKVYLLDYIVNSHLTEDISNNYHNDNLNEWSVISNLYKTLQKDIYKENLQNRKLTQELRSMMKSLPALSNELDLSYLFSEDSLPVHDTQ